MTSQPDATTVEVIDRVRQRRERQRIYEVLVRQGFTSQQARGLALSRTTVFVVPLRGGR
jgi:hypothetical protein